MQTVAISDPVGVAVPLKLSLYYESGQRVEDSDQSILHPMCPSYSPFTIKEGQSDAAVRFRLEKVSRRKDNRKFCVKIDADSDSLPPGMRPIRGVMSTPILVLSKRRTGERSSARTREYSPMDGMAGDASNGGLGGMAGRQADVLMMMRQIEQTQQTTLKLVRSMNDRLLALESRLAGSYGSSPPGPNMGVPGTFGWQDQGSGSGQLSRFFSTELPLNQGGAPNMGIPGMTPMASTRSGMAAYSGHPNGNGGGVATSGVVSTSIPSQTSQASRTMPSSASMQA